MKTLREAVAAIAAGVMTLTLTAGAQTTRTYDAGWDTAPATGDHIVVVSGDLTWDSTLPDTVGNWTQTGGTVTFDTRFPAQGTFQLFTITGDVSFATGTWTHVAQPNSETASQRLNVHVEGAFSLDATAAIDVTAKGFPRARGPGKGTWSPSSGGAYGGGAEQNPNGAYGSIVEPVDLGSGGGRNDNDIAGGAVYLVVDGAAVIDGDILANANGGNIASGSGGSIYLRAATVSGAGLLSASATTSSGGGGGSSGGAGGRIAVILDSGSDFGDLTIQAFGASSATADVRAGAAGTVYLQTAAQSTGEGRLIVDNNNVFTRQAATYSGAGGLDYSALSEIVIRNKGQLGVKAEDSLDFATLSLDAAGAANDAARIALFGVANVSLPNPFAIEDYMLVSVNTFTNYTGHLQIRPTGGLSHMYNENSTVYRLLLDIAGDLTVDAGGVINLDRKGYASEASGPVSGSGSNWGSPNRGASHGGRGRSDGTPYGNTYGSIFAPSEVGAGGTHGNDAQRGGGGAGVLTVTGTTTVNGEISARGGSTSRGASGGSITLTTGYLAGNGLIEVVGKEGGTTGGGGRIAVVLTAGTTFGTVEMTARGDHDGNVNNRSSAGTVYSQASDVAAGAGTILVSNPASTVWHTAMLLPASFPETEDYSKAELRIEAHGRVLLTDSVEVSTVVIDGANGRLDLNGMTLQAKAVTIDGTPLGSGEFSAADLGTQVEDSAGTDGRIVIPPPGTLILMR